MSNERQYYTSVSLLRAVQLVFSTLHEGKSNMAIHYVHRLLDEMRRKRASDMDGSQALQVIDMLTDAAFAMNRSDVVYSKTVLWDLHEFLCDVVPPRDACFD
jgi:hypothetical protein